MSSQSRAPGVEWTQARKELGEGGKLCVIMPFFNLCASAAENIKRVDALLSGNIPYEIIPVDDGSSDGTGRAILEAAAAAPGRIKPLLLTENVGKGMALKKAFAVSQASHVLLLDGDLDLAPNCLPRFFDVMAQSGAAAVIGSKRHPESSIDYPLSRRFVSFFYSLLVRIFIGLPVSDTQSGMKLFRHDALQWAFERMLVKRFAFDLEVLSIIAERGYKVAEAPVEMHFGDKIGCLSTSTVRNVLTDTLAVFYRLKILRYYRSVEVAPSDDNPPKISVVIACPGDSAYLREALSALETQTYRNFEVVVLPDEAIDLPSYGFELQMLPTGKVRPAEKRNKGIYASTGAVVAFLDDDAYPVSDWLERAVKYFAIADVGGVGGPGVTPPGDPYLAKMSGRVFSNILVSGNYRYRYIGDRVRSCVDDYPSCNLFIRRDLLKRIGGYSTRYWPGEDTILCADVVHGQKARIVYDPWVVVYHHRRKLFLPHLRQIGRYGLHRGYFAKRFPVTSLRLSYFVPSLFVAGVLIGAPVALLCDNFYIRAAYCGGLAFYAAVTLISSMSLFHPLNWIVTWLGVMATHFWYGIRFAVGLLSLKMPCEVAAFDHGPVGGTESGK